jgi:hypothetical protein
MEAIDARPIATSSDRFIPELPPCLLFRHPMPRNAPTNALTLALLSASEKAADVSKSTSWSGAAKVGGRSEESPSVGRPRRFDDETERRILVETADRVMARMGHQAMSLADVLSEAELSTRAFCRRPRDPGSRSQPGAH